MIWKPGSNIPVLDKFSAFEPVDIHHCSLLAGSLRMNHHHGEILINNDAADSEARLGVGELWRQRFDNFRDAVAEHWAVLNVVLRGIGIERFGYLLLPVKQIGKFVYDCAIGHECASVLICLNC